MTARRAIRHPRTLLALLIAAGALCVALAVIVALPHRPAPGPGEAASVAAQADAPALPRGVASPAEGAEPSSPPPDASSSAPGAAPRVNTAGWRVLIPSIGVNAPILAMGVDAAGQMEIPTDARSVGWYRFTAAPGSDGNAVLAGHVDWAGEVGVFGSIRTLSRGDVIEVTSQQDVAASYRVTSVTLVRPEEADIAAVVGERSGAQTLTLITCGGTWSRTTRDYDRRVVVRAERVLAPGA